MPQASDEQAAPWGLLLPASGAEQCQAWPHQLRGLPAGQGGWLCMGKPNYAISTARGSGTSCSLLGSCLLWLMGMMLPDPGMLPWLL